MKSTVTAKHQTTILDTNALISFVTDRNPAQQEEVARLFEDASRLKCLLICPQHVLNEFVFVMDKVYNQQKKTINGMIRDFINLPGIQLQHDIDFSILLNLWQKAIDDYEDAIVATIGKKTKDAQIVTFDAKFKTGLNKIGLPVFSEDS